MISYNEILTVIETFANGHKFEPRYYSEAREQLPNMATEDIVWPVLFVEPINGDTGNNTDITEVNVYCLDRLRKDRANYNDVMSDTKMILSQDLTRWLEEGQQDIEVDRSYPAEALNNYLLDYTAGWSMRVRIINERISICEVPFEGTEPDPEICEPSTVKNSDDSYSVEVASGGTLVVPDSNVSNSDDSYSVDVAATQPLELPDITHTDSDLSPVTLPAQTPMICTPVQPPEPIKSAQLLKSGQTVKYVDDDDGDVQAGRDTDRLTLPENNPFGNTNRFTDELGGSTYANNVVIDWTTYNDSIVLAYYIGDSATNRNLAQGCAWAVGLTVGGFTDWKLMNEPQMHNICDTSVTSMLNYPPFNFTVALGTSTSVSASSRVIVIPQVHQISLNPSTTGYKTFATRNYTNADLGI